MTTGFAVPGRLDDRSVEAELRDRIAKLERINSALMTHVERATDQHEGAYSLFQTAILLEGRVRSRTEELTTLMRSLERSNEALKAAKNEAETANRSKTKFLAAASHDLLQPLNAARLSSSALSDLALSDEARVIARQVERGLQTIEAVIKTLLDISKLDAGVVQARKTPVRLRSILAGIEESFRPVTEAKNLRFIIRCPDLVVESDGTLLQRTIQNLVSNAVRYTDRGGVLVAARVRDGLCALDVIDSGAGIADDERSLIFEEFYRGKQGAACSEAGLGLGLSIVRRMVSTLDHRLSVSSRVGHGSRFRITLPLATGAVAVPPDGIGDPSLGSASILVIENDEATLIALKGLLASWNLAVVAVSGLAGWRASTAAAALKPDLLIVDYHLDDGAIGLDAIAEIRAATTRRLPAIVATADHSEAVETMVLEAGCALIHKPVKPAQLRSLLSFMIASARAAG